MESYCSRLTCCKHEDKSNKFSPTFKVAVTIKKTSDLHVGYYETKKMLIRELNAMIWGTKNVI